MQSKSIITDDCLVNYQMNTREENSRMFLIRVNQFKKENTKILAFFGGQKPSGNNHGTTDNKIKKNH